MTFQSSKQMSVLITFILTSTIIQCKSVERRNIQCLNKNKKCNKITEYNFNDN